MNTLRASSKTNRVLSSGVIATTNPVTVVRAAPNETIEITTGTVCNTHSSAVTVTIEVLRDGQTADGTHVVISDLSVAADETASLVEVLGGLHLGPRESISVKASTANKLCVVFSGTVTS